MDSNKIPWLYQILATWKWNKNTSEAGVMSEANSGILDNVTWRWFLSYFRDSKEGASEEIDHTTGLG